MASKQPCTKYQYISTPSGPKIVPVSDQLSKDEESPADYNSGGYLQVKLKDTFKDGRYIVLRKLGWGHFSTVWLVKDIEQNKHSALKVVKSAGRYAETARDEIKLLRQVMEANPQHPGRNHVVSFLDSFQHYAPEDIHVCLVFEPLGENLLNLIERHKKTGVPPKLVKVITKQILLGLEYLHDECDLVHTDIKPENILISIPDVEAHIQAELSISPPATSRKVGVPPKQITRAGVAIPKRSFMTGRERHVHIFDSQPLSSPSSHSSSPLRPGLQMSRMSSTQSTLSLAVPDVKSVIKKGVSSTEPGDSTPELSDGSSGSVSTTTVATSLDSLSGTMGKLALSGSSACPCLCEEPAGGIGQEEAETDSQDQHHSLRIQTGPSLLSQTAPQNIGKRRTCIHTQEPVASCSHSPVAPLPSPPPYSASPSVCSPPPMGPPPPAAMPISIKIADLGNATPTTRHYTEDIQTQQYRSPEAILGRTDWGATADVWSAACVVFELLTAEYLFDPQSQGGVFGKDDDHMAQIIELLGDFSNDMKFGGRYSRELFDSTGALRYIRSLKPWPLKRVMVEKYLWSESDAAELCEFLEPMLVVDHRERKHAREMVNHKWLEVDPTSEDLWEV